MTTRRRFFRNLGLMGLGTAAASNANLFAGNALPDSENIRGTKENATGIPGVPAGKKPKFELGVASYGLRGLSFDELVEAMQVLQIKNLSLKSMHLPFELSDAEIKRRMKVMRDAGLNPYAPGVVYMKSEQEVHDRFAYTQTAGMKMIVAVPNYELLDLVEKKIKETGISIAIHTHGPDNLPYPTPVDAFERLEGRDPRFGICVDLGHVVRSGLDPVDQLKKVKDRILDVHIRDVSSATKDGHSCRPGTGIYDFAPTFKTLIDMDYSGFLSIEYEAEKDNPIPGHAETKGYLNGVLRGMLS